MKKIFTLIGTGIIGLGLSHVSAQNTFSDDFESYTAGQYIGVASPQFTTWSNAPGGAEDVKVVNTDARSGTNSLYWSSTAANGGPQDLILPFGSVMNTGHFTLKASFKVQPGKNGYFNLQKTATPGTAWSLDVFLSNAGIIFQNGSTYLMGTSYTQGTWIDLRLEIDLNNSRWEVYVNNAYRGFFHNPEFQFASMNIYAVAQSAFWADDISYEYTPYTPPVLNAAVSMVGGVTGGLTGQSKIPVATVRNLGTTAISSFKLNVDYNGNNYSQSFTQTIAPNTSQNIAILPGISLAMGSHLITVYISDVNGTTDALPDDDTASVLIFPTDPAPGKVVIAEEGTGTWCGWCPRGAVMMAHMENTYPGHFKGIAVHNADPMTVSAYDSGLGLTSFPGAKVDRGAVIDPSDIEAGFIPQVQIAPSAFITDGAVWDAANRKLKVSLSYAFQTTVTGNWKAALVLTENNVKGTGSGWAQNNYYAGGGNGVMGGYESLPGSVPASQRAYQDVARLITPSFGGQANSFPSPSATGTTHTLNYELDIPVGWNIDEITIVGLLIQPNGKIDNAGVAKVQEAVDNGFVEGENIGHVSVENIGSPDAAFTVFPNPAQDYSLVKIELATPSVVYMSVRDLTGKELFSRNYGKLDGAQILPVNTQNLSNGIYLIQLEMNGKRYSAKLLKQ